MLRVGSVLIHNTRRGIAKSVHKSVASTLKPNSSKLENKKKVEPFTPPSNNFVRPYKETYNQAVREYNAKYPTNKQPFITWGVG